ncbi:head-tail connector protein [Ottowia sp. SB7-C50]|uniref:head-tail connector protein n=1 Tax=Ottowia sp. SB7-C50 TaxID=3081231 RepID=UPI0029543512|nr:head-tail connector protein [Ottowia sp. SB7-C50]WOP15927.1 head-tail connector protein [Ottowia sp. SB7-C50]
MPILEQAKQHLRIDGTDSDALIQRLIDSAVLEYLQFADLPIPAAGETVMVSEDVATGIILMVQADFDGDPVKRSQHLEAARQLWNPHRGMSL